MVEWGSSYLPSRFYLYLASVVCSFIERKFPDQSKIPK
ncbi:Uncharacterised protein [Vibrio cholerae]|nr:Uncharacterised protein [Vibrio cholerae]